MQIEKNHVVTFHYSLSQDGQPLESSQGKDPMACLIGAGNIIPGLEKALLGRAAGDEFSVTLAPGDAYGEHQPQLVSRMSAKHLGVPASKLKPGMVLRLQTRRGPQVVRVVKAGRFMVDLDANHPMAGRTLTFEITVVDVREAAAEERAQGRPQVQESPPAEDAAEQES